MATLPNALALSGWPVDSSPMVAAPGRTDLASIQTAMNSLLATLGGGTAAQVLLSGGGTTVSWGGAYSSYTPTWAATGVAPALGNGVSQGRYVQIGKLVHFMMDFNPGTTSTFGTGNYTFSLPVTANTSMQGAPIGSIYANDTSAGAFSMAFPILASSTTFNMQYIATWPTGTQALYGQTAPWTWANADTIWVSGTYEAA